MSVSYWKRERERADEHRLEQREKVMIEGRDLENDLITLADEFYRNLEWQDSAYGAWGLDTKRPFGNSRVVGDLLEIFDLESDNPRYDEGDGTNCRYVEHLFMRELGPFLQQCWSELRDGEWDLWDE